VFAAVFLTGVDRRPALADAAIMKSLGAALIGVEASAIVGEGAAVPSEGFLVCSSSSPSRSTRRSTAHRRWLDEREAGENVTDRTDVVGAPPATATDGGVPGGDDE